MLKEDIKRKMQYFLYPWGIRTLTTDISTDQMKVLPAIEADEA